MVSLSRHRARTATLSNGITVLGIENPTADIVAARCFFRGGLRLEARERAGIGHLVASTMTKGTQYDSAHAIAEQVESVGASLGTEAATDYFLLSFKTVGGDFERILKLSAEILRSPTFPTSEVELERRLTLRAIEAQRERPFSVAYDRLQCLLYGEHPYGFPAMGWTETVSQLSRDDLVAYHRQALRPDRLTIAWAGRLAFADAIAALERTFGDWHAEDNPLPDPEATVPEFQPELGVTLQDTQQAIVMLGYAAPPVSSPDYAALKVITTYLGSGMSSRLFVELREKRGLAYEVSAFYPTRLDRSQFVTYMGTAPQNAGIALEGLHQECDRLCQEVLDADELATTKSKLLGQYALSKQTNSQLAQVYGWYETLGLGADYDERFVQAIEAVTAEDVQRVAQGYLNVPAVSLLGSEEAAALVRDRMTQLLSP